MNTGIDDTTHAIKYKGRWWFVHVKAIPCSNGELYYWFQNGKSHAVCMTGIPEIEIELET